MIQVEKGGDSVSIGAYAQIASALGAEFTVLPARRPTLDEGRYLFTYAQEAPRAEEISLLMPQRAEQYASPALHPIFQRLRLMRSLADSSIGMAQPELKRHHRQRAAILRGSDGEGTNNIKPESFFVKSPH